MKRLLYLLCAALLCLAPAVWAQTSLRWCLNEVASPPWRLGLEHRPRLSEKGERAQGLEYDFLRLLASRSGLQFQWVQRPWRRCLLELQRGEHDAMMAMSYLPEREPLYRFPMREGRPDEARAIQRFSYYLYVAKGQPSPWDGQQWQLPAGTAVAVPMGYSIATVLRDQGVSVDDSQRGTEEVLGKLVSGQVAVAALPFDEVEGVLKREAATQVVRFIHGNDAAVDALENWDRVHRERQVPEDMPSHVVATPALLVDVMVACKLAPSKGQARRFIEGGGVKLDGVKVSDTQTQVEVPGADGSVLSHGRRQFVRLIRA